MALQRSITAASSSSASTSYRCYDVFINHRGPDVKDNFASHLYRRLLGHGLQVFLDREELEEGHQISSQIEAAIRVAAVQIAIFSPTYAESYWCLNELLLMVSSGATILPVFYHVEPSMLRRAVGPYGEALHNLQQKTTRDPLTGEKKPRYDSNTVQSWRNALSHVADISGFVLHGDEGELLENVVKSVVNKVPKTPLDVAKYPTGLGEKLQEFERTVQESKTVGAKVVGIVGLGGIGKSTLAKEFFNLRRSDYNASCFLFEVREIARTMSLPYLQSKLIHELKHTDIKIESRDQGIGELKKNLSSCHALIILDDVDHIDQMDAFLPIKDILSQESLILVTSRDKHVLRSSGVLDSSIYNLQGLNRTDSEELFCCYAFCLRHPLPGFADLVDRFVMACDGLPLSLKVFGALVCGQKQSYWQGILDRLGQLPTEIQERLRISYDSLDEDDQTIFLDIVCFFIGEQIDMAIKIWGIVGLQNLENKCLLGVDSKNSIKMHDHIRDMGRCIAKGLMPHRFYERSNSNVLDILEQSSSVITEARGISMVNCSTSTESISKLWFSDTYLYKGWRHKLLGNGMWKLPIKDRYKCTNLKFLVMKDLYLRDLLRRVKSPHLIWLRWYNCPYSSLPSWVPINNLRVLEVYGKRLKMLWQSETQAPLDLRGLFIFAPLSYFPKSIGQLKYLQKIVVDHLGISHLKTLPEEFCNLWSLKCLVLRNCSRMMSLPESFGKLTNLQHIDLSSATSLNSLPESFGELTNLQHIDLSLASSLKSLPESFGMLSNLQYIEMSGVSNFQMIPNSFGNLTKLQHLALTCASGLQMLPDSFGRLTNLQFLNLGGADRLKTLPNSFSNLSRLKHLELWNCHNLTLSGGTLGNIATLEYLNLEDCKNVKELPPQVARQPSLKILKLSRTDLKELPNDVGNLSSLEHLWLGSESLEELPPSLFYLERLKELQLSGCPKLKCLPESFELVTRWTELVIVPYRLYTQGNLEIFLSIANCPLLELPEILFLKGGGAFNTNLKDNRMFGLKRLTLSLKEWDNIAFPEGVCPNLQYLRLEGWTRQIGELCGLAKLQFLKIVWCENLEELPSLETLISLERLQVSNCPKLKSIEGLAHLTKLKKICVYDCNELQEVAGVEYVMSLSFLQVIQCDKLQLAVEQLQLLRQRLKEGLHIENKGANERVVCGVHY